MGVIILIAIVLFLCNIWDRESCPPPVNVKTKKKKWVAAEAVAPAGGPEWVQAAVVGVTYDGRQAVVARMRPGDAVTLRRDPANPYDGNAVRVENAAGEQAGFLDRHLAARLAPRLDRLGGVLPGSVTEVTGGGDQGFHCGLRIRFYVQ